MTIDDDDEGKESRDEDKDKGVGKGVGDRVVDERVSSVKDNGFKAEGRVNDGGRRELQVQKFLQVQQQQSQGTAPAVDWERFLPIRSIKVLLVENDDSTRHIVTALLRNCNYEVIEAAHGVQAWKILENLTNQVDLVLTEVVMPCMSGVGLLFKIMSHKTRKNIPVIMMSSHDSMGLVFKCLSKGAVDFLVKPIRKNELKNLWQHVWRRCHSSSGSGSESGTQTQKSVHTKSSEKSDGSSSNAGENNGSNGFNNVDGSDDGSGAQSSWTKRPLRVESSQVPSPTCQVAECPDSKCAQVNRSNAETSSYKRVHITAKREAQEEEQSGYKDHLPDTTNNFDSETQSPIDILARVTGAKQNNLLEMPSSSSTSRMDKGEENPSGKLQSNKHNVIKIDSSDPQINGREFEAPRELTNTQQAENNTEDSPKKTAVELSLKRLRGIKDSEMIIQYNPNLLKHSELSAFSRYDTSSSGAKAPKGITGSSYIIDDSYEIANKDSLCGHTNGNLVFPGSKVVSNIIDMGSTTIFSGNPIFFSSEATSTINVLYPSSAFQLVKNDQRNTPQQAAQLKPTDMQTSPVPSPTRGVQLELQIQHRIDYHHQQHDHHFQSSKQEHKLSNYDKASLSMKKMAVDSANCGSSNVLGAPDDGDPGNYCVNRSATGSNYGSNGQIGGSTGVNAGATNGESQGLGGNIGSRDATGSGFGNRVDENKLAQREAALLKFRQKRKERCFKKKVRYQNRKRLAEQRPRVRGQFVRQTDHSNSNGAADE